MPDSSSPGGLRQISQDLGRPRQVMSRLWGRRAFWQIRLRWWVPPALVLAVVASPAFDVRFETSPVLAAAGFILFYNLVFALVLQRRPHLRRPATDHDRLYTILQVALDYASMFWLIHFTGGPASPLIFFLVLHVIFAAILFRPSTAYLFAVAATAGVALVSVAKFEGWILCHPILIRGQAFSFLDRPGHLTLQIAFFSVSVFVVAALTTRIMTRMRRGVAHVADVTERVAVLNDRLNSLYAMVRAVGRERNLEPILSIVTSELAAVMDVAVVTVKLLDEDGETLRYVASHGLPPEFGRENVVRLDRSRVNRRVIEERAVIVERVDAVDEFQLLPQLRAMGLSWVLFAPLTVDDHVIGVLGAYRRDPRGFPESEGDFLRLASELVAVAIEDARRNEEIQDLMQERSQFMLQVAHNLRAPLGASIGMLDLATGGSLGELPPRAEGYLARVERRLRGMNDLIGELLTLARTGDRTRPAEAVVVDLRALAEEVDRSFRPRADLKKIVYEVETADGLRPLTGDPGLLEQLVENLVSNALKYTPEGGRVNVRFRDDGEETLVLEVEDTGIGVPTAEREHLFHEFFRASNARALEETGTGLGLAIVQRTVDRLGGTLDFDSEEGRGTRVTVALPRRP